MDSFLHQIERILPAERIQRAPTSEADAIDGTVPALVLFADSEEEIVAILAAAREDQASLIPRGSGSQMALGNLTKDPVAVLDLSLLDQTIELEPRDLYVRAQCGTRLGGLQESLSVHRLFLPHDPPYPHRRTLGGCISTNLPTPLTYRYGGLREHVMGLRIATGEGRIIKVGGEVVKNVAGYDLVRLFTGSLGTLGIILDCSLNLRPMPTVSRLVLLGTATFDAALSLAIKAHNLIGEFSFVDVLAPADNHANLTALRKHTEAPFVTAIAVEGMEEGVAWLTKQIEEQTGGDSVEVLNAESSSALRWPLQDFPWDVELGLVMRISALTSQSAEVNECLRRFADEAQLDLNVRAHVGSNFVRASANPTGQEDEALAHGMARLSRELEHIDAIMIIERAPAELKAGRDVWGSSPQPLAIMRQIKTSYDPAGILNPGRFVGNI